MLATAAMYSIWLSLLTAVSHQLTALQAGMAPQLVQNLCKAGVILGHMYVDCSTAGRADLFPR